MFPDLSSFYVSQNNIFPNYMLQGSFDLLKSDPKLICLEIFALKVNIYFSDGYVGSLSLSRYISLIPTAAVVIIPIWLVSLQVSPARRETLIMCLDLLIVFGDSVHLLAPQQTAPQPPGSNFSKQNIFSVRVSRPFALYWDIDNHTGGNNSIDKI